MSWHIRQSLTVETIQDIAEKCAQFTSLDDAPEVCNVMFYSVAADIYKLLLDEALLQKSVDDFPDM